MDDEGVVPCHDRRAQRLHSFSEPIWGYLHADVASSSMGRGSVVNMPRASKWRPLSLMMNQQSASQFIS